MGKLYQQIRQRIRFIRSTKIPTFKQTHLIFQSHFYFIRKNYGTNRTKIRWYFNGEYHPYQKCRQACQTLARPRSSGGGGGFGNERRNQPTHRFGS
ncbi:hypothetical protein [Moraxella lacunata]|uniref:hypothetical protein n=1 Tax=Moraxella lacunata TaxID=477 RepID=UPI003EDF20AE